VMIINGYMRTDKWFRLSRLAYYLSKRTGYNYNLLPIDTSPVCTTGWLAGFIDADGSFGVNINFFANTGYPRITTVFAISQALFTSLGTPNLSVMQSIAYFLGLSLLSHTEINLLCGQVVLILYHYYLIILINTLS
jgi:hypothetical protein